MLWFKSILFKVKVGLLTNNQAETDQQTATDSDTLYYNTTPNDTVKDLGIFYYMYMSLYTDNVNLA